MTGNLRLLTVALFSSALTLAFVLSCGNENKAHGNSDTGEQAEVPVPSVLDCSAWEVMVARNEEEWEYLSGGETSTVWALESGWEPVSMDGSRVFLRRCVSQ